MKQSRGGRKPGPSTTREALLVAAQEVFADRGYDAATTREIAGKAGVDPAMIHHYFGSKEQLFQETVKAPIDLKDVLAEVLAGPVDDLAEGMLRTVLGLWDSSMAPAGLAIIRSALQHEWSAKLAREFVLTRGIRPIVSRVESDPHRIALRSSLIASQIAGLIFTRYLLKIEPLASASHDDIVRMIGPTLQRYLTGELPA